MPAVSPNEIVRAIIDAIVESGGQAQLTSKAQAHPRCFNVVTPKEGFSLWVYIWTITHGGATRSEQEYRIQMTTVTPPLAINPTGLTLLLGWYPDLQVFGGFDLNHHINFSPGSNSVQISLASLQSANNYGWGFYTNQFQEISVAFRPAEFLNYALNSETLHREGPAAINFLNRVSRLEPVSQTEIAQAPEPRRRIVEAISRLARATNFRDQVTSAYNNCCAITRMQMRLIDAAHILPVGAEGSTDHVTNGLCLSPTYHRAFDQGLIYLRPDYRMSFNPARIERLRSLNIVGGIEQIQHYIDQEIFLPANPDQRPSVDMIRRANAFRGISTSV